MVMDKFISLRYHYFILISLTSTLQLFSVFLTVHVYSDRATSNGIASLFILSRVLVTIDWVWIGK
jgi:hypothetical protein